MCMGDGRDHGLVLACPLSEGSGLAFARKFLAPVLRKWSKIVFPILWWPTTIRINIVHFLGISLLVVIIMNWSWSFVVLWCLSLLF
jgi:hypothetical protein